MLEEFLRSGDELLVDATDDVLRGIEDEDVRLKLRVLEVCLAVLLQITYYRDAEDEGRILSGDPVDGSHRAWHRSADKLTDVLMLIHPWRAVSIRIVCLTLQHDGWLVVNGVKAYRTTQRHGQPE